MGRPEPQVGLVCFKQPFWGSRRGSLQEKTRRTQDGAPELAAPKVGSSCSAKLPEFSPGRWGVSDGVTIGRGDGLLHRERLLLPWGGGPAAALGRPIGVCPAAASPACRDARTDRSHQTSSRSGRRVSAPTRGLSPGGLQRSVPRSCASWDSHPAGPMHAASQSASHEVKQRVE